MNNSHTQRWIIYGNSGIGKTHLLTAIGNHLRSQYPQTKIGYVSGSDFVDFVYQAYKEKKYDELKDSFKNVDLLLVDDIQFLENKEKTQNAILLELKEKLDINYIDLGEEKGQTQKRQQK